MDRQPFYAPKGSPALTISFASFLGLINNFYSAYGISYINTGEVAFKAYINDSFVVHSKEYPTTLDPRTQMWYWSAIMNCNMVGSFIGNFFSPIICDGIGRKNALILGNVAVALINGISTYSIIAHRPLIFMLSRVVGYAGSTINQGALYLLIMESSPTQTRGAANVASGTSFAVGMWVGMLLGMDDFLGGNLPVLVGICSGISLLAAVIGFFIPESPKWLLIMRGERERALRSLDFYHGSDAADPDGDKQALINEMIEEGESESGGEGNKPTTFTLLKELLTRSHLRNAIILSLILFQLGVSGGPITTELLSAYFSSEIAQISSTVLLVIAFVAGVAGIYIIQKISRRALIISTATVSVAVGALYVLFDRMAKWLHSEFSYGALACMAVGSIASNIGFGKLASLVMGELLPQRHRSTGGAVVMNVNLAIGFLFSLVTLPLYEMCGIGVFIGLFTVPGVLCIVYLYIYLPETANKEVTEIMEELKRRYGGGDSRVVGG